MAAAFTALRVLLGIFFFLTGVLKVSDWFSADLHRHMVSVATVSAGPGDAGPSLGVMNRLGAAVHRAESTLACKAELRGIGTGCGVGLSSRGNV